MARAHVARISQNEYGISHDILYNPLKSKCVMFPPKRYKLATPSVYLNGKTLDYVENIKYLAVILSNLKDDEDILRQVRCLYASANTLIHKFARCSQHVKVILVESYCCNFIVVHYGTIFKKNVVFIS